MIRRTDLTMLMGRLSKAPIPVGTREVLLWVVKEFRGDLDIDKFIGEPGHPGGHSQRPERGDRDMSKTIPDDDGITAAATLEYEAASDEHFGPTYYIDGIGMCFKHAMEHVAAHDPDFASMVAPLPRERQQQLLAIYDLGQMHRQGMSTTFVQMVRERGFTAAQAGTALLVSMATTLGAYAAFFMTSESDDDLAVQEALDGINAHTAKAFNAVADRGGPYFAVIQQSMADASQRYAADKALSVAINKGLVARGETETPETQQPVVAPKPTLH